MAITFQTENVKPPGIKKREVSRWIKTIVESYGKKAGDIAFLFCDDEKILAVNRQYLSHDYFTDIITFNYSEKELVSGDIIISLDTVLSNSEKYHTEFEEELHRVIIHGILHLCGLNDTLEEEKTCMKNAEDKALKILNMSRLQ